MVQMERILERWKCSGYRMMKRYSFRHCDWIYAKASVFIRLVIDPHAYNIGGWTSIFLVCKLFCLGIRIIFPISILVEMNENHTKYSEILTGHRRHDGSLLWELKNNSFYKYIFYSAKHSTYKSMNRNQRLKYWLGVISNAFRMCLRSIKFCQEGHLNQ